MICISSNRAMVPSHRPDEHKVNAYEDFGGNYVTFWNPLPHALTVGSTIKASPPPCIGSIETLGHTAPKIHTILTDRLVEFLETQGAVF